MKRSAPISQLIETRLSRRGFLAGAAAAATLTAARPVWARSGPPVSFEEVDSSISPRLRAPTGYHADVLLSWGDPILAGDSGFDLQRLDGAAQRRRFGYNCDFTAFMPLASDGAGIAAQSTRGLLCVNHEYTTHTLMFPGLPKLKPGRSLNEAQVGIEMAAHGHSIVEVEKRGNRWSVVRGNYNRRIHPETTIRLAGPAAGHPRLWTLADPSGHWVKGTLSNCAGGVTPWGTVLIAEENFHKYFVGDVRGTCEERNHTEYHCGDLIEMTWFWHRHSERFDLNKHPNEPNRFGWVTEIDPYDPESTPVKRTALGRRSHECANCTVDRSGKAVVYGGDDRVFEYIYKFVTADAVRPKREDNHDLLDDGVLYTAQFGLDGHVRWLPLVYGDGPLTKENDFHSQADVLIECRRAARLMGATPMDRPEDVEIDPVTGRVYVMLTQNKGRLGKDRDAANPRTVNTHGHVIEITPPGAGSGAVDHAAPVHRWDILLLAGDPREPTHRSTYGPGVSDHGWLANPDNAAFDSFGRLWIATDGAPRSAKVADGLWHCGLDGKDRAVTRRLLALPDGAECCGPTFTPDAKTLFVSVQHPGEGSRFENPSTRWPDFDPSVPPRPSVVAITKKDGGVVGS